MKLIEIVELRRDELKLVCRRIYLHSIDELKVLYGNIDRVAGVQYGASSGYVLFLFLGENFLLVGF